MYFQSKHLYAMLILSTIGVASGFLWVISHPKVKQQPKNEIEAWTRGTLTERNWVTYDKIPFVGDTSLYFRKEEDVYFWVLNSTSTSQIVVESKSATTGPWGAPTVQVENVFVYGNEDYLIFPFTINIPKAKAFFSENDSIKILKDERRWDTRYFKFKINKQRGVEIQEWLLDEDTHIAEKIKVTVEKPNMTKRGRIMNMQESSFFIGDELPFTVTVLTQVSLIVGPITLITLFYQVKKEVVEQEEKRLKSEEYKEKWRKKYEKERERWGI